MVRRGRVRAVVGQSSVSVETRWRGESCARTGRDGVTWGLNHDGGERGVDTAVGSPVPPPAASSSRFSHYRREPPRHRQATAVVTRQMRLRHHVTSSHYVIIKRARVYDDRKM